MNLVQYLIESVTTFEVTLTSDTVTPLRVTLGHPMVDPTAVKSTVKRFVTIIRFLRQIAADGDPP